MAARQDQTLQIATICLAGLSLVLGGSLIWVNRLRSDAQQAETAATEAKRAADEAVRKTQGEKETLLTAMGFQATDPVDEVSTQFDADLEKYGATLPEGSKSYRAMLETFHQESLKNEKEVSEAKQQIKELEDRMRQRVAELTAQVDQFKAQVGSVQKDAAGERAKFTAAREDLMSKREDLAAALARQEASFEEQIATLNTSISQKDSTLADRNQALEKLIDERQQFEPSFEVSDGRITWVNQRNQTVWINLGSADSLARQVTFSVYEQDANDAGKAEKKASIEVVRILDDHLAEARITGDDARNPILPGDWIYSQVWDRGKKIHFALTGVVDIDDDGASDLQQARDLIALNGGVVDAYLDDNGKVEGELSVETRYLVIGDFAEGSVNNAAAKREGFSAMSESAKNLGVETITLRQFLNQMGYRPLERTVGLGGRMDEGDFYPRAGDRPQFRPRTPYSSTGRDPLAP